MTARGNRRRDATLDLVSAVCVAGLALASCSPVVVVVHQDHTREAVDVWVDREYVGQLEPGEELSEKVERGHHLIEARPRGEQHSPWTRDGQGWQVFVDRGTILTLLPIEEEAGEHSGREKTEGDKGKKSLPIVMPEGDGGEGGDGSDSARTDQGYEERPSVVGDNPY